MTDFVCGTIFSWDLKRFVVIKKNRPDWMAGKYNFVGGKIEEKPEISGLWETPRQAISREFEEETGVITQPKNWHCFHIEQYANTTSAPDKQRAKVYYLATFGDDINKVKTITDEEVKIMNYEDLTWDPKEFIFNIPYIIAMLLTQVREKTFYSLNPEGVNYGLGQH